MLPEASEDILKTLDATHASLEQQRACGPAAPPARATMDVMLSSPDAAASPQAAAADIAMLLRAAEQHRKLAQLLPDEDMRREMLAEADKQEVQAQALMRRGAAGAGGTWQDLDAQRLSVGPQQPPPPAPGVGSFVDRNGRVVEFQKGPVVEPAVASAPPPGVGNFVDRYGRVVEFHKRPADEPIGAGSSELAASAGGAPAPAGSTVRAVLRRDSGGLFKLGLREGAGGVLIGRLPLSDAEGDERTRLCEGDLVLTINGLRTNTMSFEQLRSYVKECPGALHLEVRRMPGGVPGGAPTRDTVGGGMGGGGGGMGGGAEPDPLEAVAGGVIHGLESLKKGFRQLVDSRESRENLEKLRDLGDELKEKTKGFFEQLGGLGQGGSDVGGGAKGGGGMGGGGMGSGGGMGGRGAATGGDPDARYGSHNVDELTARAEAAARAARAVASTAPAPGSLGGVGAVASPLLHSNAADSTSILPVPHSAGTRPAVQAPPMGAPSSGARAGLFVDRYGNPVEFQIRPPAAPADPSFFPTSSPTSSMGGGVGLVDGPHHGAAGLVNTGRMGGAVMGGAGVELLDEATQLALALSLSEAEFAASAHHGASGVPRPVPSAEYLGGLYPTSPPPPPPSDGSMPPPSMPPPPLDSMAALYSMTPPSQPLPFPGLYGGYNNDHFPQASPPPPPMYPPPPPGPPPPDGMYSGAMSEEELLQVAMHLSLAEAQAQQAAERAALETALRASATETPVGDLLGELGAQPPTIAEDLATVFAGRVPAPAVEPPNFC